MKSRYLITLLCVGAVAFACGPRARSDANGATASGTTVSTVSSVAQQGTPRTTRKSASSAIRTTLSVSSEAAAIRFGLEVENRSSKTVELTFPSGQTHDFVILDSLGREVWRWGRGRLFTQALQNRLLARGESLELSETWDSPALEPGRYTAVATLRSENYPAVQETEFAVRGATLAARD